MLVQACFGEVFARGESERLTMQGVTRSDVELFHRFHFDPRGIACRHPDGGGRTRNRYVDRRAIDWRSSRSEAAIRSGACRAEQALNRLWSSSFD
jgi:hypothetical protein